MIFTVPICIIIHGCRQTVFLCESCLIFAVIFKRVKHRMKQKNLNETNSALLGYNRRKPIFSPDNAKHIFICGTTGSGKTVALSNYMQNCMKKKTFPC